MAVSFLEFRRHCAKQKITLHKAFAKQAIQLYGTDEMYWGAFVWQAGSYA